jgi:hypothetical protein
METKEFTRRLRILGIGKGELSLAVGHPRWYISAILAQERLDREEAQSMLAVARRMHDERMATIID